MLAVLAAGLSAAAAALIALAGYSGGWVLAAAVGLSVLALAGGWAQLLGLPHRRGTALLVGGTGLVAVGVAVQVAAEPHPLAAFAGVIAGGVLAAFGHELVRRDGRADLVESVTGTLSGQVLAVLAAGWVLLPATSAEESGVIVTAIAVGSARLATALPYRLRVTAWVGFAFGLVGTTAAALLLPDVPPLAAATIGITVAGTVAALDRLLMAEEPGRRGGATAVLARAAAPVAAAGTVAYAAVRLVVG